MHRNTVKYRVSEVLDDDEVLAARNRMDLAPALQVCHFLGPAVLTAPSGQDGAAAAPA